MGFFLRKPRIMRMPRVPHSVKLGPVRVRKGGGSGSVSAGPVGYGWRTKRRKQR